MNSTAINNALKDISNNGLNTKIYYKDAAGEICDVSSLTVEPTLDGFPCEEFELNSVEPGSSIGLRIHYSSISSDEGYVKLACHAYFCISLDYIPKKPYCINKHDYELAMSQPVTGITYMGTESIISVHGTIPKYKVVG